MANIVVVTLLGYFETAPMVEGALVAVGVMMLFAIGFYLLRRSFPSKEPSILKLQIRPVEVDVWSPEHIHPEAPQSCCRCEIEIENVGGITACDISVEILSIELMQDVMKWQFPLPLQTTEAHNRTLNPGEKMKMLFIDEPSIVELSGKKAVKGAIANHGGAFILVDKEYRMTLRVIAENMHPLLGNYVFRFVSERGLYAFKICQGWP